MRNAGFCNCNANRHGRAIDETGPRVAVNAIPMGHQIGAEQVASAIRKPQLSVPVAVFDLAIAGNVGY
jgi:hypothetical protein